MAGLCNADPLHRLTVDAPPPPIAKDMHGSDSSVPLSPQWLLPKLRDNRLGQASGEVHLYVGKHTEPVKVLGNAEEHNVPEKKKDAFRPSFYDTEHGRWDHWHDEERAANSAVRRDRRREGEELVASRKADRWSDSSFRYSVEARHFPSERWTDSGNKESSYEQRRDSKWNSRWGPEDKESENWREKLSGKDGESTRDKGSPNIAAIHGKDIKYQSRDTDKEGEHHTHSWRSSPSINRSRVESSPYVPPTTNKLAPMFGYGRGKGENGPILNIGRNKAYLSTSSATDSLSQHFHLGNASDRSSGSHGDPLIMRYSRMKLLDIYRTTDLKGYKLPSEGFQEVPTLMRAMPLEPLALTAPIAEELVILKAIDKGEIVASGVPQASKDCSTGKNSVDSGLLLPTKSGIGENAAPVVSDHRDGSIGNGNKDNSCYKESALYEKCSYLFDSEISRRQNLHQYHEDKLIAEEFGSPPDKACESSNREVSKLESTIPWRSQLVSGGSLQSSNDPRGLDEDRSGSTNMGLLNTQKHAGSEQRNSYDVSSAYLRSDPQWQDTLNLPLEVRNKSQIRRQTSKIIEQEREGLLNLHGQDDPLIFRHKLADRKPQPYLLPEDLSLFYRDPHGEIQGPFSGSNLIEWFDAGYFGIDLQVRLTGTPADAPFSLLGDVIPQLRTRVRPPPGFGTPRLNDIVDVANRGNFVGSSSVHAGVAQFELMKNGQVLGNETKVEAENRFLESLMSRRTSSSLSESCLLPEGMQGYDGFAGVGSLSGTENMSDMKQLSRKMSLEQQSTVPTPYWHGRELPAILSKTDPVPDPSFHPPKYLHQIEEASRHVPRSPQNLNLQSQPIPSSLPLWPSSEAQTLKNAHGSMDFLKDTSELHHSLQNTHIGFGTPNLETQPQPLPNLNPLGNHSSGVMLQEKLVAPELSQDPQVINLLQHQYMLNQQVHSQVPPLTHLNMELLLLMQRQKQEQQLNQMLLQQKQQQQFLAHALSGHQSHQYFDEPSFGHLNAGVVDEKASLNNPILQQMHEMVQRKHQMHVLDSSDSVVSNLSKLNLHDAQDASFTVGTGHLPLNLPNQFLKPTSHPNAMDSTPSLDVGRTENSDAYQIASMGDGLVSAEDGSVQDPFLSQINTRDINTSVASQGLSRTNEMVTIASDAENNLALSKKGSRNLDLTLTVSEKIDDVKISPNTISGQAYAESPGLVVVEVTEPQELKKVPEKKSRKQKNSQLRAVSEHGKGQLKAAPSQHSRTNLETGATKKGIHMEVLEPLYRAPEAKSENSAPSAMESLDSANAHLLSSGGFIDKKNDVNEGKVESEFGLSISKAWKPAPGQKRKSLLEIQREEQYRVHTESLASDVLPEITMTNASVIPLVGSINREQKYAVDTVHGVSLTRPVSENPGNPWNSKITRSPLEYVLVEEVLAKPGGKDAKGIDEQHELLPPLTQAGSHIGEFVTAVDDFDFVQTKETRKGRKKAMKNKGAAGNASVPVTSPDLSVYASTTDKTKAIRQTEQNKESLPAPPAAPSFGDFVLWKTDEASSVPAPAWSSDAAKLQKPTSLRDILKEQDKQTKSGPQQIPIPTPAKVQPTRGSGGISSSWQVSGSSQSKVAFPLNSKSASPAQTGSHSLGQPKMATEYDLFWGPLNQAKQGSSSASSKEVQGTPVKESYGEGSNRKASSSKAAEHSIPSSPAITQSLSKGKKNSESKYTEAMDFRDWCEGEWLRLTGTSDTSFLEFILKQTTTEVEALLRENLGSLDRSHEFIDKFINYKEFLSAEVIEIAFRGQRRSKEDHAQASHGTRVSREGVDGVADGSTKGKKGKKGKKLSPALLGFNVVSNRIMMGEIQTIED